MQDPLSRIAYLAATSASVDRLQEGLPEWVWGWRARGDRSIGDNRDEWPRYLESLQKLQGSEFALSVDVTSCFASIDLGRLETILRSRLGSSTPTAVMLDVVQAHDGLTSRSGLPQRSFASAALAHLYLRPLDDTLESALGDPRVRQVSRWMDDITAVGSESRLYRLHIELEERCRQIGLNLNHAKSFLRPASTMNESLQLDELREIDVPFTLLGGGAYGDLEYWPDLDDLLKFEEEVLSGRLIHPSVVRAVVATLEKMGEYGRVREWMAKAHTFPHLIDVLASYFRDFAEETDQAPAGAAHAVYEKWAESFLTSEWATLDWVASQVVLSLPVKYLGQFQRDLLRSWLESSENVQKVAIAGQRLGAYEPASCRDRIRRRVDRLNDPLLLRALAMALLGAGDDRDSVRAVLLRDARNALTIKYLESRNWQPPDALAHIQGYEDYEDDDAGPGEACSS
ncbi:RNA-directed DNA polymerase [Actinomycetospora termitidis]|uniref:RNA-directed DNA polymerase n=1 Tax=Actinomycetospora termitidis TaxID=3053470 RepID=A0ABT7MF35_9PSEU|nr:RNA-directed DNA polymerase [Actinomycetospora sp. Odt1-22]MDL5159279.1 RNA-directed DNA polymerase [Actinomycetospora sp. Odt1-22]